MKRDFSQITEEEARAMWQEAVQACIAYAESIGMTGLSAPRWNLYQGLEDAIVGKHKEVSEPSVV